MNGVDRDGTPLSGEDTHGAWMGTQLRPVPIDYDLLDPRRRTNARMLRFVVDSFVRGTPFHAYVKAPAADCIEEWLRGAGHTDVRVRRLKLNGTAIGDGDEPCAEDLEDEQRTPHPLPQEKGK